MDQTLQTIQVYSLKLSDENIFAYYLIDYFWKIVQIKMALMVRQLNFKVCHDIQVREEEVQAELQQQRYKYELEIIELNKTIE